MASLGYIASALVMGFMLVALALGIARGRKWKQYATERDERDTVAVLRGIASNPTVWVLSFVLFSLVAGAGAVLFVSGTAVPASLRRGARLAVVALAVVLGGGYIFWGTYQSSRYRGLDSAQATLAALWVGGALFVLAVIVKLVTA
ncbi:hypothetical protein [Haladaptatus halobius]|uniref:hypothetical protein n=1 Tax=Haladaptatus halobius TaxID=2884875 RepID=UPI001D099EEF|nr:hypothetical protein [Haladaptatus halobius]